MEGRCSATGANVEALPLSMWIDELENRDLCVTKSDIDNLGANEEVKILFIDQHVFDLAESRGDAGSLRPEDFFRSHYWCIFRKSEGMSGWARFMCESRFRAFEFHVEYRPGYWCQLSHGRLPSHIVGNTGEQPRLKIEDYPGTIRVGWRGPSVRWTSLKDMPNVYLG